MSLLFALGFFQQRQASVGYWQVPLHTKVMMVDAPLGLQPVWNIIYPLLPAATKRKVQFLSAGKAVVAVEELPLARGTDCGGRQYRKTCSSGNYLSARKARKPTGSKRVWRCLCSQELQGSHSAKVLQRVMDLNRDASGSGAVPKSLP